MPFKRKFCCRCYAEARARAEALKTSHGRDLKDAERVAAAAAERARGDARLQLSRVEAAAEAAREKIAAAEAGAAVRPSVSRTHTYFVTV